MKDKKGFTLIELLAVIVILAIIALIATPIIMNVINDGKKGAAKDSAYGYVKAASLAATQNIMKTGKALNGNYVTKDSNIYSGSTKVLDVSIKGTKPEDNGTVTFTKGEITHAELVFDGIRVIYDGNKAEVSDEETTPPVETKSFAEDSWETIIDNVKKGNTSNYHVGDTKEVTLTGEVAGTYTVRIANMSSDDPVCSNSSYSETACGFVLEFADIITEFVINLKSTNVGGWPISLMRVYVNDTIYNALPEELRNGIIDTRVVSGHGSEDTANFTSTDKLYLLSTKELWGKEGTSNQVENDTAEEETKQLDYYKSLGVTTDNSSGAIKNYNGTPIWWWLRSSSSYNNYRFLFADYAGKGYDTEANDAGGVSPAFRIG